MPTFFGTFWIIMGVLAYRKNGEYGAPWGLLYMQQEQEREKLNEKFLKEIAKEKNQITMSSDYIGDLSKLKAMR